MKFAFWMLVMCAGIVLVFWHPELETQNWWVDQLGMILLGYLMAATSFFVLIYLVVNGQPTREEEPQYYRSR